MTDQKFIEIAQEFLRAVTNELDPFTTKKGQILVGKSQVVLLTPDHIQFAKYGRVPGKNPPRDNIQKWVDREGIIFDGSTAEGTAIAIQLSIGKNGTKNYVPNAPNALEESIKNNIDNYNQQLNGALIVEVTDQIYKEYQKIFPSNMEMKV